MDIYYWFITNNVICTQYARGIKCTHLCWAYVTDSHCSSAHMFTQRSTVMEQQAIFFEQMWQKLYSYFFAQVREVLGVYLVCL